MPALEWDDAMNLGHAEIDRQHKTLVGLINRVRACGDGPDRDVEVMNGITAMYLYAKQHFFDEEALMDRLGYPEAEEHKAQHLGFVRKTHALTDACLAGDADAGEVAEFLISWLRTHIAVEDAKIVRLAGGSPPAER